jgi:formyl-CoA transferase
MMDFQAARYLMKDEVPGQAGNDHPTNIPTGVFKTSDGHVNIAAADNLMFSRLCKALGVEDAISDPLYATDVARSANRKSLNARIEAVTQGNTSEHWINALAAGQVPCGTINSMDKVFADPQVQHLGMARTINHTTLGPIQVVNQAIKLSRTPPNPHTAIGEMGEANQEILTELGYSAADIDALRAGGVI